MLSRKKSKLERYNQYIQNILKKKTGLIYYVPELLKQISEKVNRNESIIANWHESVLINSSSSCSITPKQPI
ncbi:MAG: hypothetical protein V3V84_03380 [Candidatus Bathyarchaeia archaeon]